MFAFYTPRYVLDTKIMPNLEKLNHAILQKCKDGNEESQACLTVCYLIQRFLISYSDPPTGAYLAKSLNEAVGMVTGNGVLADKVEGVFIIGGSSVYEVMFITY